MHWYDVSMRPRAIPFGLVLLVAVASSGCSVNQSGRTWEVADRRSEKVGTRIGVRLLTGENESRRENELWAIGGCLEYHIEISVYDEIDRWTVYRVTERTAAGLLQKQFVITDPPGKEFQGASTEARPDQVVGIERLPTGLAFEPSPLRQSPVVLEWQISDASAADEWLAEGDSKRVLGGTKTLSAAEPQDEYVVSLCKQQLEKLLQYPAEEFRLLIRATPEGWGAASDGKLVHARRPLSRDTIQKFHGEAGKLSPAKQSKSPGPDAGEGGGSSTPR